MLLDRLGLHHRGRGAGPGRGAPGAGDTVRPALQQPAGRGLPADHLAAPPGQPLGAGQPQAHRRHPRDRRPELPAQLPARPEPGPHLHLGRERRVRPAPVRGTPAVLEGRLRLRRRLQDTGRVRSRLWPPRGRTHLGEPRAGGDLPLEGRRPRHGRRPGGLGRRTVGHRRPPQPGPLLRHRPPRHRPVRPGVAPPRRPRLRGRPRLQPALHRRRRTGHARPLREPQGAGHRPRWERLHRRRRRVPGPSRPARRHHDDLCRCRLVLLPPGRVRGEARDRSTQPADRHGRRS